MKKLSVVFICLIASVAMLLGLFIFTISMTANGWDFSKLSSSNTLERSYECEEKITDVSIFLDTEDITILPSSDGKTKFVFKESESLKHTVSCDGGKASISVEDTRKWYNYIFNFTETSITLYLPEESYSSLIINADTSDVEIAKDFNFDFIDISLSTGDVVSRASASVSTKIKVSTGRINLSDAKTGELNLTSSTGDMTLSNIEADDVAIKVSTGDVEIRNTSLKSLITLGSTGELKMSGVVASGKWSIERSTGDLEFEACDAMEIYILTDTGEVTGTLLSEKIFIVKTDTGDINVPRTATGGICEIITDTGDIEIYIKN